MSDDLVLLAGGGVAKVHPGNSEYAGEPEERPILQAIDAGGERFGVTRRPRSGEIEPGAITTAPNGDVVMPVYEHDLSLQVLRYSRGGELVAADELPDNPYDVVTYDIASKLRVAVTPLGDEAYLCAWLYRQGRRMGITYRRWGEPGHEWIGAEWPVHVSEDMVIGANENAWVCRDLPTGSLRWAITSTGIQPVGAAGASFMTIDLNDFDRNESTVPAGGRSIVLALAPETGRARWETPVDGLVRSAAVDPDGIVVCTEHADGSRHLTSIAHGGAVRAGRRLDEVDGPAFNLTSQGLSPVRDAAVVVGKTAELTLLLLDGNRLVAFDDALAPAWAVPVEPPRFCYTARIADNRLTTVPLAVAGRRAYLRTPAGLHVVEW